MYRLVFMNAKKAVVLLSGGLDSATVIALAVRDGFAVHAMTFAYGQKHSVEIACASAIAESVRVQEHLVIQIPALLFTGSSLSAESNMRVPRGGECSGGNIPTTYVPARNIIFLSYALAYSEKIDAAAIFTGVNAVDYSGYPDCRPEFIEAFQRMANIGTKMGLERGIAICAPLINMTKAEIIALGSGMGVDYSLTHSCYDPGDDGASCGECDSCILRKKGFAEAGVPDPTRYGKA